MQDEINQNEKNKIWELVPRLDDKNIIGEKWVFQKEKNEDEKIVWNKARFVCKGYDQ